MLGDLGSVPAKNFIRSVNEEQSGGLSMSHEPRELLLFAVMCCEQGDGHQDRQPEEPRDPARSALLFPVGRTFYVYHGKQVV